MRLLLALFKHQDMPFEKLVEILNPKRDASRSPMFQVMLSMLNTPMQPLQLVGPTTSADHSRQRDSKFELTCMPSRAGELRLTCEYNTDFFRSDRIERLLGHLEVLLEGIVDKPDRAFGIAAVDGARASAHAGQLERHAGRLFARM